VTPYVRRGVLQPHINVGERLVAYPWFTVSGGQRRSRNEAGQTDT